MVRYLRMFFLIFVIQQSFAAKPSTSISTAPIYDNSKTNLVITAKQPVFTIKLKSNPTTGYSWFLREYDDTIFTRVKHEFLNTSEGGLMGAPGYETFTFKVKPAAFTMPEVSSIRFVYMRPFSGIESASQILFHIALMQK